MKTSRLARALGLLLLATALLLSLPGIRAVRADEPDMTPVATDEFSAVETADLVAIEPVPIADPIAESCGDPAAGKRSATPRTDVMVQLAHPQAVAPAAVGESGPILLNNRGYNYGSPVGSPATANSAHWQQVEREVQARGR